MDVFRGNGESVGVWVYGILNFLIIMWFIIVFILVKILIFCIKSVVNI